MKHIGGLILIVLVNFLVWLFIDKNREEYEWYVPIVSGAIMWIIIEAFYWSVYLIING